ncbi:hypothetical protein ACA910_000239 [Epithemia clementina (nom. ined.)]
MSASLPFAPGGSRTYRSISGGSNPPNRMSSTSSAGSSGGYGGSASLLTSPPPPPPPTLLTHANSSGGSSAPVTTSTLSSYRMAQSMTIDEMRHLHRRALQEAEAKRTELRLVLASRYRELVGSSDEVLRMKERAKELHDLIHALPDLMEKLQQPNQQLKQATSFNRETKKKDCEEKDEEIVAVQRARRQFSELTRSVHRALDRNHVHLATTNLLELFCLFAYHTNKYPLANSLAAQQASFSNTRPGTSNENMDKLDPTLEAQMRMIYFQVQTLPRRILKLSRANLLEAASFSNADSFYDPAMGAERSAAALASLDILSQRKNTEVGHDRAAVLLDTYFGSKAQLLGSLFNQLTVKAANQAEAILSKIVLILQHDVIVHPYEIFVLRKFPGNSAMAIMETLPLFDPTTVRTRCSKFLASHLPMIRTKVKSVLVSIAGTTASALGQIRQSLYDKTDGIECQRALNENPVCSWDDAVSGIVDVRQVLSHTEMTSDRKFSLWSALFSHTFSSLVHSLLTTSFHSVHSKVVATLRASLSQAPPLDQLLPHEAYRNTMRIATDLDQALLKVSDDAHELLVHAEEREESERRLRQSLYVQTCEILGRLLCEVRRIVTEQDDKAALDGTRQLIVGRLCYFLKFRLKSLPTLLNQNSTPAGAKAQSASTAGMISYVDLESAFSLADDDDDGLISFPEAMDATESAFSGTQFHGAEMLRGTLFLSSIDSSKPLEGQEHCDVTLYELMLLTARGLRHGTGQYSALGMVQKALDDIVGSCFEKWADAALQSSMQSFSRKNSEFWKTAVSTTDDEWQALHTGIENAASSSMSVLDKITGVSPQTLGFVMNASFIMNQTTTPADSLTSVPSKDHAFSLGITQGTVSSLTETLRWTLLRRSLRLFCTVGLESLASLKADPPNATATLQYSLDVAFVKYCYIERNQHGLGGGESEESAKRQIDDLAKKVHRFVSNVVSRDVLLSLPNVAVEKNRHVDEACDIFFTSLFGSRSSIASVAEAGEFDLGSAGSSQQLPFCYTPLSSSRRFALLPIQSDRTLADLQMKGAYKKEKEEQERRQESIGGSVMSSGLGFFSSMLKKK